jgi:hypothetical protein
MNAVMGTWFSRRRSRRLAANDASPLTWKVSATCWRSRGPALTKLGALEALEEAPGLVDADGLDEDPEPATVDGVGADRARLDEQAATTPAAAAATTPRKARRSSTGPP